MRIAVLWRRNRNVEQQQQLLGKTIPDDSREEVERHQQALTECGHHVEIVEWHNDPIRTVKKLRRGRYDLVFNASSVEEVAILEGFGLRFAGSHIDLVSLDKVVRKEIVACHAVSTPEFQVIRDPEAEFTLAIEPPVIVKPARGRNSSGISEESIVSDVCGVLRQARQIVSGLHQDALVERFVPGTEVTVGVIGNRSPEILGVMEIEYTDATTNTFEHKQDHEVFHCPARLSDTVRARVETDAVNAYRALRARDYARIDMIVDGQGIPHFLELNCFPGLHQLTGDERHLHSSYMGTMAANAGMSAADLYGMIIDIAGADEAFETSAHVSAISQTT